MVIHVQQTASRQTGSRALSASVARLGPGRYCETCRHSKRLEIDLALLAGESLRSIAERTGLSHSSISRHKQNCLPQDILQARISKKLLDGDFLVAKVSKLIRSLENVLDKAEEADKAMLVLATVREFRPTLELLAKFSTRSKTETEQPDLKITAEFTVLRTTILAALQPFPQARVAVAAALSRETFSAAHKMPPKTEKA
jgi:hypothetical protein